MEINEKFLEIIYQLVIKQNKYLLKEISEREQIPYAELHELFLKNPRKQFKAYINKITITTTTTTITQTTTTTTTTITTQTTNEQNSNVSKSPSSLS
jgi:hypothetical protein